MHYKIGNSPCVQTDKSSSGSGEHEGHALSLGPNFLQLAQIVCWRPHPQGLVMRKLSVDNNLKGIQDEFRQ